MKSLFGLAAAICLLSSVVLMVVLVWQARQSSKDARASNVNSRASAPGTSTGQRINVPMASPWTNTGVEVKQDQRLLINASGQGVWKNVNDGNPNTYPKAQEECGPDGTAPVDSEDYYSNISEYQCPQSYKGALIGKIGQGGRCFPVGSRYSEVMTQTGVLYLGINDKKPVTGMSDWADNSGGFEADINLLGEGGTTRAPAARALAGYGDQHITVNSDGSWSVTVPSWLDAGVPLRFSDGREFQIKRGEEIEITATGFVNIGRGLVGPDGEPGYYDATTDGPFADHVGGLEMWIGNIKGANRFLIGSRLRRRFDHPGVPTLRVIESMHGYADGNVGSFTATVRRR